MKIVIVMDPVSGINIEKDTTFALALEAQSRGFEIYVCMMDQLKMRNEIPYATLHKGFFTRDSPCCSWPSEPFEAPLDDFDFVLMRKDPPFDEQFFMATHFLSLCKKAKIVNRAKSLRDAPEKIYSLNFPGIFPETLITRNALEIQDFMKEQGGEIIVKPLNKCGGSGIIYLHSEDKNFHSLIELSTGEGEEYIMAQRYLPEIRQGDKRVILVNGKAAGAIMRIPSDQDHRGNIHAGGSVEFSELTERDEWLIQQISEQLVADGLFFVGLDIIGDYVTEINVTSPTGVQEILNLGGIDVAKIFWDELTSFQG